ADSGYLTRRLVDVSQDVIVREEDCGTSKGIYVKEIKEGNEVIECLKDRLVGRYTFEPISDPKTGELIIEASTFITEKTADKIVAVGIDEVGIRSVFTCGTRYGVCAKCYGMNMGTAEKVNIGEAVGIVAAQSIGEPGTQLTMRTFHTGGVATTGDITNGLPRVEELFEARRPKGLAIVSEIKGVVSFDETTRILSVTPLEPTHDEKDVAEYKIVFGQKLRVENGAIVEAGDPLTFGNIYPQDILRTKGIRGVQDYIIAGVKETYNSAGVDINEKHLEIIVRQMLRRVKIESQGDTDMLPGDYVDIFTYEAENDRIVNEGGAPATAKRTLLGITKASLASESFLSAASFQETAKVLTEAAIKNKVDGLKGLKENVILGKLIPAGTGMKMYRNIVALPKNNGENAIIEESISEKFSVEEDIED
ncbi:MAG: DNA-directed RNA polymerase subunit beta', partial [Clostridia bacterium]